MKNAWPVLSWEKGKATYETLQLFTQIVGKIKLAILPWVNHSWHITLHVTPSGLTTQTIPYKDQHFQIDFDFMHHQLKITTDETMRQFNLHHCSVADFYQRIFELLRELSIDITIKTLPAEIAGPLTPFDQDTAHATYEADQAIDFHQALLNIQHVFMLFRSEFTGKCSPIHFFWGGFDLSLSFFSGRKAPAHPGKMVGLPDRVLQDAYSNEVYDCGFWTGTESFPEAAFYSYLYPEPDGYKDAKVSPSEAYYHPEMREFILPYSAVQQAADPEAQLLAFLRSTYKIGSGLAKWDREMCEYERQEYNKLNRTIQ
jgi:hypothetical protein